MGSSSSKGSKPNDDAQSNKIMKTSSALSNTTTSNASPDTTVSNASPDTTANKTNSIILERHDENENPDSRDKTDGCDSGLTNEYNELIAKNLERFGSPNGSLFGNTKAPSKYDTDASSHMKFDSKNKMDAYGTNRLDELVDKNLASLVCSGILNGGREAHIFEDLTSKSSSANRETSSDDDIEILSPLPSLSLPSSLSSPSSLSPQPSLSPPSTPPVPLKSILKTPPTSRDSERERESILETPPPSGDSERERKCQFELKVKVSEFDTDECVSKDKVVTYSTPLKFMECQKHSTNKMTTEQWKTKIQEGQKACKLLQSPDATDVEYCEAIATIESCFGILNEIPSIGKRAPKITPDERWPRDDKKKKIQEQQQKALEDMKKKVNDLEYETQHYVLQLCSQDDEIKKLRGTLKTKDDTIQRLQSELCKQWEESQKLRHGLNQRNDEVNSLKSKDDAIQRLQSELCKQCEESQNLRYILNQRDDKIKDLAFKLNNKERYSQFLFEMMETLSSIADNAEGKAHLDGGTSNGVIASAVSSSTQTSGGDFEFSKAQSDYLDELIDHIFGSEKKTGDETLEQPQVQPALSSPEEEKLQSDKINTSSTNRISYAEALKKNMSPPEADSAQNMSNKGTPTQNGGSQKPLSRDVPNQNPPTNSAPTQNGGSQKSLSRDTPTQNGANWNPPKRPNTQKTKKGPRRHHPKHK